MCDSTLAQTFPNTQQPDCDADAALARARRETRLTRARQCRIMAWQCAYRLDAATAAQDERAAATWRAERETLIAEATRLEADGAE